MYGFPEDPRFLHFKARAGGGQTANANVTTKALLPAVYENTGNRYDIALSRYYPPPGWNLLGFNAVLQRQSGAGSLNGRSQILRNSVNWGIISSYSQKNGTQVGCHCSKLVLVHSGDYFELHVFATQAYIVNGVTCFWGVHFRDMPIPDSTYRGEFF